MHPKMSCRRSLFWGLALIAGVVGTSYAQPPMPQPTPPAVAVKIDKSGALIVPVQGLVEFELKGDPPTDVLITREDVLSVRPSPAKPNVLLLTGRQPGVTQLKLVYKDKPAVVYDVVVQADLDLLRSLIKRTVPTANVEVTPGIGNVIILSGYVTSPQDADIVARLANSASGGAVNSVINAVQVGGVQQVQIDVVIASVNRTEARNRGFDFFFNGKTVQFGSLVSGLLGTSTIGGGTALSNTPSSNANLVFSVVPTQFFGALQALRTENLAKFLAEPKVVTQTGRPAFFLDGGQQAIISASSGITGPGVSYQQIGTQLEVLPIVYGNGLIWLELNPQVTTVNTGLGITTTFGTTPGFSQQQLRCAVMLESGQTFAIGGLIQNSIQASTARVPVLGDIPYLGVLFSQISQMESETELVILVTPRLVHPMDCNQVPKRLPGRETRIPDDYELFLENVMEAPRGQRKVWNGRCYNAAYKCDPTATTFPCINGVCTGVNGAGGPGCQPGGLPPAIRGLSEPPGMILPGGPAPAPVPAQPVPPIPPAVPASGHQPEAPPTSPMPAPVVSPPMPTEPVVLPPVPSDPQPVEGSPVEPTLPPVAVPGAPN